MSTKSATDYQVTFQKGEEVWQVTAKCEQTLFELAKQCQAPVETLCHGIAACVRCKVKVVDGVLTPPTHTERDRLGNIFHLTHERLACQARVCSDVTVQIKERKSRRKKSQQRGRTRRSNTAVAKMNPS